MLASVRAMSERARGVAAARRRPQGFDDISLGLFVLADDEALVAVEPLVEHALRCATWNATFDDPLTGREGVGDRTDDDTLAAVEDLEHLANGAHEQLLVLVVVGRGSIDDEDEIGARRIAVAVVGVRLSGAGLCDGAPA